MDSLVQQHDQKTRINDLKEWQTNGAEREAYVFKGYPLVAKLHLDEMDKDGNPKFASNESEANVYELYLNGAGLTPHC
jgi:hypothetical protein